MPPESLSLTPSPEPQPQPHPEAGVRLKTWLETQLLPLLMEAGSGSQTALLRSLAPSLLAKVRFSNGDAAALVERFESLLDGAYDAVYGEADPQ